MPKTVKFFTLGCKVNQYDTQSLRERILSSGFRELKSGLKADIYVINTCTVTASADRKSRYLIHHAHRNNPKAKIFVTGCSVELGGAKILNMPGVAKIIRRKKAETGISDFFGHTRAFLKVQDGCSNHCSYCKVPLVRGKSRSRPLEDIKEEAQRLVQRGFKEIVLCGICLGAYGRDLKPKKDLAAVIKELEGIPGLIRIRLSSIEAGDVSDELIERMANSKKLCRHLHIPIQSGDDTILEQMRRGYHSRDYLALIRKIKKRIPDIAITTDVLVGFPGEKEENFRNTAELIRKIQPLRAHIFPYSRREGTVAYGLKGNIPAQEIKARIIKLRRICAECSLNYIGKSLGKEMHVLIEDCLVANPKLWYGYTDNYIKVGVESEANLKNKMVRVVLERTDKDHLLGRITG